MTTAEKLAAIRARCVELLENSWGQSGPDRAGWRSTIAAIDWYLSAKDMRMTVGPDAVYCEGLDNGKLYVIESFESAATAILAAWEGQV